MTARAARGALAALAAFLLVAGCESSTDGDDGRAYTTVARNIAWTLPDTVGVPVRIGFQGEAGPDGCYHYLGYTLERFDVDTWIVEPRIQYDNRGGACATVLVTYEDTLVIEAPKAGLLILRGVSAAPTIVGSTWVATGRVSGHGVR
jgi:hypothetical protein